MPHKLGISLLSATLAWAIIASCTSTAQELQPYAPPILHTFLDSAKVYPESEVKRHLLSPDGKVDLSKLPDEYGYFASAWSGRIEVPIVLLEKIH